MPEPTPNVPYWSRTLRDPLKGLIIVYMALLIVEGALRKWVLPGLSNQLLLVRDPLVLLIYFLTFLRTRKPFTNPYTVAMFLLALGSLVLTLISGHGDPVVALFGFRVLVLHFPLIFVVGQVMDREDVIQMGKILLLVVFPMTMLIAAQFNSPTGAWVNRLPGGETGYGLTGALGRFRPPGTFSFITGVVQFYTLAAAFSMSSLVERRYLPLWMAGVAATAIVVAIPVSISRNLFLNVLILVFAAMYGLKRAGASTRGLMRLAILVVVVSFVATRFEVFEEGVETFQARWDASVDASGGVEEAVVGRFLGLLIDPFRNVWEMPLSGHGIGLGTIVGGRIISGRQAFLMGEGEWGRHIMEMGPVLGVGVILLRLILTVKIGIYCHRQLRRRNLLSWLLFSATFLLMLNGQWGQPTTLGFTMVGMGLALAAAKRTMSPANDTMQDRDSERRRDADSSPEGLPA